MVSNKTRPTGASVDEHLAAVEPAGRREDAIRLRALMEEVSGERATLWGDSLIGFGEYHYRYDSGREGDFFRIGFAARKANLVLYLMAGVEAHPELLERLGKHRTGQSCLYLTRLAKVDEAVLRELVEAAWAAMVERYPLEDGSPSRP